MLYGLTSAVIIPDKQGWCAKCLHLHTPHVQRYIHILYSTLRFGENDDVALPASLGCSRSLVFWGGGLLFP